MPDFITVVNFATVLSVPTTYFFCETCIDPRHRKQVYRDIGNTSCALCRAKENPMPWQLKNLMDIRQEFVTLTLQEGANRREL